MNIWHILAIEETTNLIEIKKAYATEIKKHKPETDPEGFQRVRTAYERALQFARGEPVSFEIPDLHASDTDNEISFQDKDFPEKTIEEYSFHNLQRFAFYLLDLLSTDQEEEALAHFEEMSKKGELDNLELSLEFQKFIAPRLTDKAQNFPHFTSQLIDYFQWQNHPETNSESLFGITLRTLIQQTAYYRFFLELQTKSLIKNKAQAKKMGIDWNYCYAIKTLLECRKSYRLFFSIKKRKAVAKLLKEIDYHRSAVLKPDLQNNILLWLRNYGKSRFHLVRLCLFIVFISAYTITAYTKHKKVFTNTTEQSKNTKQRIPNIIPSTSTNIVITFSDYKGTPLQGSKSYLLHIPSVKNDATEDVTWTIMLFDENYKILNKLITNSQLLYKNRDGSIDIYLQSQKPAKNDSNWLEAPKGNFIVVGQFFWKKNGEIITNWDGLTIKSG